MAIAGIILAAGFGKRFESQNSKLLSFVAQKPILYYSIQHAARAGLKPLIIVTGHQQEYIKQTLMKYDLPELLWLSNPRYHEGKATSIQCALQALIPQSAIQAAMFVLGDMPSIKPQTLKDLITVFYQETPLIVIPKYQEQLGNPVIFSRELFSDLLKLRAEEGGKNIFTKYRKQTSIVKTNDAGVIFDIDTQEDLKKYILQIESEAL